MQLFKLKLSIGYKKIFIRSLLLASLGMSGCRTLPLDLADRATSELGVPVFLWAYNDDTCAVRNLKALYDEYNDLSRRAENTFEQRLSSAYAAVIVNATEETGRVTGLVRRVELRDPARVNRVLNSRKFADLRNSETGHFPGVVVQKGHELVIQTYEGLDESQVETYRTTDRSVYQNLGTDDALFNRAIQDGRLTRTSVQPSRTESPCGRELRLSELF